jgi:hypothetical protein
MNVCRKDAALETKGVLEMTKLGHVVSVREVTCEFGKSTGWQAVLKIYKDDRLEEIQSTVWADKASAMLDRDMMAEHIEMYLN